MTASCRRAEGDAGRGCSLRPRVPGKSLPGKLARHLPCNIIHSLPHNLREKGDSKYIKRLPISRRDGGIGGLRPFCNLHFQNYQYREWNLASWPRIRPSSLRLLHKSLFLVAKRQNGHRLFDRNDLTKYTDSCIIRLFG